jgi:hypothetical protein
MRSAAERGRRLPPSISARRGRPRRESGRFQMVNSEQIRHAPIGRVFEQFSFAANGLCKHTMNYLQQEKCLRDHEACRRSHPPVAELILPVAGVERPWSSGSSLPQPPGAEGEVCEADIPLLSHIPPGCGWRLPCSRARVCNLFQASVVIAPVTGNKSGTCQGGCPRCPAMDTPRLVSGCDGTSAVQPV